MERQESPFGQVRELGWGRTLFFENKLCEFTNHFMANIPQNHLKSEISLTHFRPEMPASLGAAAFARNTPSPGPSASALPPSIGRPN